MSLYPPLQDQDLDLDALLLTHAYDALSPAQQAAVAAYLTEAEYRELHALAQEVAALEAPAHLQPRPGLPRQLRQRLRQQRRQARWQPLWQYRLPVWQVAAAAVFLFLALRLGPWAGAPQAPTPPAPTMVADSTHHDSTLRRSVNLYEDSVFARFLRETL